MAKKTKEANVVSESDFQFFTEVDMNQYGNVGGFIPSYMNRSLVEDLKREIDDEERSLAKQDLNPERRSILSKSVYKKKERLEKIENETPNLDKDKVNDASKEVGKLISSAMFSEYDMKKGLADAHEEARRMSDRCIKVTSEIANILKGCNIQVDKENPMVSRTHLEKAWKIMNRYLGESSNVERLRRAK
jgi:hypothetical protein